MACTHCIWDDCLIVSFYMNKIWIKFQLIKTLLVLLQVAIHANQKTLEMCMKSTYAMTSASLPFNFGNKSIVWVWYDVSLSLSNIFMHHWCWCVCWCFHQWHSNNECKLYQSKQQHWIDFFVFKLGYSISIAIQFTNHQQW